MEAKLAAIYTAIVVVGVDVALVLYKVLDLGQLGQ